MKIASNVLVDNKNKNVYIVFNDGSRTFKGFEIFDEVD